MAYTLFHGYGLIAHESFYIEYIEYPPHSFRGGSPHRHNVGEFMLVERGCAQIVIESDSYQVDGQYLLYFPPYSVHRHINNMEYAYNRYCFSVRRTPVLPRSRRWAILKRYAGIWMLT